MLAWAEDVILSAAEASRVRSIATESIDRTLAILAQTRATLAALPIDTLSRAELLAKVTQAQQAALKLRQERIDQVSEQLNFEGFQGLKLVKVRLDALFASFSHRTVLLGSLCGSCLNGEVRVLTAHAFLRSIVGRQRFHRLINCLNISIARTAKQVETRSRASHIRQLAPIGAPPVGCNA